MKCAHCKERDVTIQHVKVCAYEEAVGKGIDMAANGLVFEHKTSPALKFASEDTNLVDALEASIRLGKEMELLDEEAEAAARLDAMTGAHGRDMASEKQVKYVMDLLLEHQWPDALTAADVENMERRQVTKLIDALKASPRKDEDGVLTPTGRYCLLVGGDDAMSYSAVDRQDLIKFKEPTLRFYEVTRKDEGRWAGRTWVAQLFGAPGDYRREPVRGAAMVRVLTQINKDPAEAALRYGRESGVCGVCRSPLTNQDSLDRGIGPVCAKKRGW